MNYPPLLNCKSIDEYRAHFESTYCKAPISTFDGITVRFRKRDFNHCFFESSHRDSVKDTFSQRRAERLYWIKTALEDPGSERYQGWDKKRKRYDANRRVIVVMGNYVVVIAITGAKTADFKTAFVAETQTSTGQFSTIDKIRRSPEWT